MAACGVDSQDCQIAAQGRQRRRVALHERAARRAARESLDAQSAGTREQVQHRQTGEHAGGLVGKRRVARRSTLWRRLHQERREEL